jgi:hypothetical protein
MESATATTDKFRVMRGSDLEHRLWCFGCLAFTPLDATEPKAAEAEAEPLKGEHDAETCQANRTKPLGSGIWSRDAGEGRHNPVEGEG